MRKGLCRSAAWRHLASAFVLGGLVLSLPLPREAAAQVKKTQIKNAIKAAFSTWEKASCSKLQFEFHDQPTFVSPQTGVKGAIYVYFGHDNNSWISGKAAYQVGVQNKDKTNGSITFATIGMNARNWTWTIGKKAKAIDIETAMVPMIASTLGFYVGSDQQSGSFTDFINTDLVNHKLHPLHEMGARYTYFESGTGCTRPDMPPICGKGGIGLDAGASSGDGSTDGGSSGSAIRLCIYHSDPTNPQSGKPYAWAAQPIKVYIYIPSSGRLPGGTLPSGDGGGTTSGDGGGTSSGDGGGGIIGDGGSGGKECTKTNDCDTNEICDVNGKCVSTGDDGCCRMTYTRSENVAYALLMIFLLGYFIRRQRRRDAGRR